MRNTEMLAEGQGQDWEEIIEQRIKTSEDLRKGELDFTGKVAVITGAASGIGNAIAIDFAEHGAHVVIVDINDERGQYTAERLNENRQDSASYIHTDVSKKAEIEEMAALVLSRYGSVDYLINNAGIEDNSAGNIITMPDETLNKIIGVNLMGYVNCARAIVPLMSKGGCIIDVSSVQAFGVHRPGNIYQVTKNAHFGLTAALAVELADRKIRAVTIVPGAIATEGMGYNRSGDPHALDSLRMSTPLGRRGTPSEISWAILFACSDRSSFLDGTCITIDGGLTIFGGLNPLEKEVAPDDPDFLAE